MQSDYFVALFTKDGERSLPDTLRSIDNQTLKPSFVIAVDDGSIDNTNEILHNGFSKNNRIEVLKTESKTRDIRRAPYLLNLALSRAREIGDIPYMMVSGDDCVYPSNYAEEALKRMQANRKIAIASGTWIYDEAPTGSGRFVSMNFMQKIGGFYPTFYGWESWLLTKAQQLGYDLKVFHDLRYAHLRPYQARRIFEWGVCMNFMGYPFYSVIHRLVSGMTLPPKKRQLHMNSLIAMTAGYFASRIRGDKTLQDEEFKDYIRFNSTRTLAYAPVNLAIKIGIRIFRHDQAS